MVVSSLCRVSGEVRVKVEDVFGGLDLSILESLACCHCNGPAEDQPKARTTLEHGAATGRMDGWRQQRKSQL
jgi:hypothetical protein